MGFVTAERLIEGTGTPEPVWQRWLATARVRAQPLQGWLPQTARLVVIAPHPDDEVLACGALLAMHAARGGEILVVAVTDGEASHPGSSEWSPRRLAAVRRAESAEGLARLGLRGIAPVRLGLGDGKVCQQAADLAKGLKSLLCSTDVVVTTWRLDGHPDHDATGRSAAGACAAAGCRLVEAPVWMWHWAAPGDLRVPWYRLQGLPLSPQALARKQAAVAAHVTQLARRDAEEGPVLGSAILSRSTRTTEYFFM